MCSIPRLSFMWLDIDGYAETNKGLYLSEKTFIFLVKTNNMKKIYLLGILVIVLHSILGASTSHIITTSGLTFVPDSIFVNVGDTMIFNLDLSAHPLQQVSSATWAANQATPLAGGFSANSGNTFKVVMSQPGIIFYVSTADVSSGMKGRIFVDGENGIHNVSPATVSSYPNPCDQQLHIITATAGRYSLALTDMLGRTVLRNDISTSQGILTLDIAAVAQGDYIVAIKGADGISSQSKITIRH
jgi:plastocyanin